MSIGDMVGVATNTASHAGLTGGDPVIGRETAMGAWLNTDLATNLKRAGPDVQKTRKQPDTTVIAPQRIHKGRHDGAEFR